METTVAEIRKRRREQLGETEEEQKKREEELKAKQPTPEQRLAEGKAYIRRREKLASRTGVSSKRAGLALAEEENISQEEINKLETMQRAEEVLKQQSEEQKITKLPEQPTQEQGLTTMGLSLGQREQDEQSFINAFLFGPKMPEGEELVTGTLPITPASAGTIPAVAKVFTKARFVNLAKKMTIPLVFIGGAFFHSVMNDFLEGGATERQGAVNTYGQMAGDILEDVSISLKTPNRAYADFDYLEQQITDRERELKEKWVAPVYLKVTGQLHDVQADLADAKNLVQSARGDVLNIQIREPDLIELAEFIERRRKFYGIEPKIIEEEFKSIREGF
jgi:hypothetical protein